MQRGVLVRVPVHRADERDARLAARSARAARSSRCRRRWAWRARSRRGASDASSSPVGLRHRDRERRALARAAVRSAAACAIRPPPAVAARRGRCRASRRQITCSTLCWKSTTGTRAAPGQVRHRREEVADADVDVARRELIGRGALHVRDAPAPEVHRAAARPRSGPAPWRTPALPRLSAAYAGAVTRSQPRQLRAQLVHVVARRVRRDHRHVVPLRQLADRVEAADAAAAGERPEPAHLDPQDPHPRPRGDVLGSSPSMKMRCQSSRFASSQSRSPWRAAPRDARPRAARARPASNSPRAQRPRAQHELLDQRPGGPAQPAARPAPESPSCAALRISPRHEVAQRLAQHRLGAPAAQLEAARQRGHVLDQRVVQEGHAALDRRRHAHLVLLHQQLDEIGLEVGVAHPLERVPARPRRRRAAMRAYGSRVLGLAQQAAAPRSASREDGEVVEEERARPVAERQERAPRVAAQRPRQRGHQIAALRRGPAPASRPRRGARAARSRP